MTHTLAAVFRLDLAVCVLEQLDSVQLRAVDDVVGLEVLEVLLDLVEGELYRVELWRVRRIEDGKDLELLHLFQDAFVSVHGQVVHEQEEGLTLHLVAEELEEVEELLDGD